MRSGQLIIEIIFIILKKDKQAHRFHVRKNMVDSEVMIVEYARYSFTQIFTLLLLNFSMHRVLMYVIYPYPLFPCVFFEIAYLETFRLNYSSVFQRIPFLHHTHSHGGLSTSLAALVSSYLVILVCCGPRFSLVWV